MDARGLNTRFNRTVSNTVYSVVKIESIAFKSQCKLDFFAFAHVRNRVLLLIYCRILAFALHGVFVIVFNNTGIVDCTFNKSIGVVENFGVGITRFAAENDTQIESASVCGGVFADFGIQHINRKGLIFTEENFSGFTAFFKCRLKAGFFKGFKSHYSAPPLPPTVISLTRMRGWPTFVGTLPDDEPHMP